MTVYILSRLEKYCFKLKISFVIYIFIATIQGVSFAMCLGSTTVMGCYGKYRISVR